MTQAATDIQARLIAAANARQRGDAAGEIRLLDEALKIAPKNPLVLNSRGMRALADEDFKQAARLFEKAGAAEPREPALWMNLATARRALGDDEGERQALQRALEIDRFLFMALLRKAELEERCANDREALFAWTGVIQLASSSVDRPPVMDEAILRGQAFVAAQGAKIAAKVDEQFGADRAGDPDMRRFNACVDHVVGRRAIYTHECQGLHFPFLPADEFFDRRLFPWLTGIERDTDAIRAEALALVADAGEDIRPYVRMEKGGPASKWTPLDNSLDWGACFLWEYGEPNPAVIDRCPVTAAALDRLPRNRIPGKAPSAFFSILKAGAHIPPHTGVTNTRAIVHLPLVVPPECRFRVGGETREWKEGEAFAFDDTIEHEAVNGSDRDRIVLIFDVWNPHLSEQEQDLLTRYFALQDDPAAGVV